LGAAANTAVVVTGCSTAVLGPTPIVAALAIATAMAMCLCCPFISVLASRPGTSAITPSDG
jgi:hypothetical protein